MDITPFHVFKLIVEWTVSIVGGVMVGILIVGLIYGIISSICGILRGD